MPPDTPAPPNGQGGDAFTGRHRRLSAVRAVIAYLVIALALLGVSQLLWLWHSWPVRHVLDSEQLIVGALL